ncbi:hypothetical protein QYE76_039611 [Lolium multiflorum]|uniref:CCHC-type domain-containing protein n=1 Tax=Lolium multiflorum TaxID=4521 RepID=A0AAD8TB87_LOLMU|nr:hypothetical protein QYE76_039611 [Lolium multiflorum]
MEGVEGMLKKMRLSEEEKKGVKVGGGLTGKVKAAELQAVGKLMSERPVAEEYLKRALGGIWCPMNGTICKELGDNRFRFTFSQASGKSKALKEGPWMFNHELLVMVDFDPRKTLDEETAEAIGAEFGGLLDVETDEDGTAVGKFLRIKVILDIRVPLRRGIKLLEDVELDTGGLQELERWCPFQYEFLPDFCYCCGRLGHKKDYCQSGDKKSKSLEYGPELVAKKFGEDRGRSSPGGFGGSWGGAGSGGKSGSRSGSASWRKDGVGSGPLVKQNKVDGEEVTSPMKKVSGGSGVEGKRLEKDLALVVLEPGKEKETRGAMEVEAELDPITAGTSLVPNVAKEEFMVTSTVGKGESASSLPRETKMGTFTRRPRSTKQVEGMASGKLGAKRALELEETEKEETAKKARSHQGEKEQNTSAVAQKLAGLTVDGLLELQRAEEPDVLFLSEMKMDRRGMEKFRVLLNMPNMEVYDCDGRSGGLALFWKRDVKLCVSPVKTRYHIEAEITGEDGFVWRLTGIYGEPKTSDKEKTWRLLQILHGQSNLPWMCFGDFNEILFASEKQGGKVKNQAAMERFRHALDACELEDLGYIGDPYTWRNNSSSAGTYIKERLDRAVANLTWRQHFPAYKTINGDPRHSDHRPIIVVMDPDYEPNRPNTNRVIAQPKFEGKWLEEEECEEIVYNSWNMAILNGNRAVT